MGRKHSEETKQKLRQARLRHLDKGMTGKHHTAETKAKISLAQTGRQRSEYPWYVGAKAYHIRRNAERREIAWLLTETDAKKLITAECYFCGMPTVPVTCTKNWNLTGVNGIDRLDSSLPYALENCVTACTTCNIAKAQLSVADFYEWIKRVHSRLPK